MRIVHKSLAAKPHPIHEALAMTTLRRRSFPFLLLAAALIAGPALAEVLAQGKVKGGYYW